MVGETGGGKTTMRNILKEAMSFEPVLNILEDKYLASGTAYAQYTCSVTEMTKKEINSSKVMCKAEFI